MNIETNNMITLNNNEKYAILEKINFEDIDYYYVALINEIQTDIKDEYKIIKIENNSNTNYIIEITEQELLNKLLPIFLDKMPS